ncbi:hypothetical protein ACJIZ3_003247 [Penstemon smallii]|uniref:ZC3H15/TMA46 family C-terminal domain-containing protein n=1 Tax=Penstemon smallii TaxID=265156 RepID=A0ABD3U8P6_9LAMI
MGAEEEKNKKASETNPNQNSNLNPNRNSITEAQFSAWKSRKDANACASKAEAARKRAEDIAAGVVQMNGRELFVHEPWVFDNTQY